MVEQWNGIIFKTNNKMKNLNEIKSRLVDRGSFDLSSDKEFSELTRQEQNSVRDYVRFYLLMES
jgi:hypothetical protein